MSFTKESMLDHFKLKETALMYDTTTGGITKVLTNDGLSLYLESSSLKRRVVLDNLVERSCYKGIDCSNSCYHDWSSEALVGYLAATMNNDQAAKVTTSAMDAQVISSNVFANLETYVREW